MWVWILGGLIGWVLVALVLAVVIGRGVRLADQRSGATDGAAPLRSPRRRVPSRRSASGWPRPPWSWRRSATSSA